MVSIIPNWQLPRNPYIFLGETCEDLNMMFFLKIRWSPFPTYTPKTNMEHPPTNLTDFWNKHDVSLKRKKWGLMNWVFLTDHFRWKFGTIFRSQIWALIIFQPPVTCKTASRNSSTSWRNLSSCAKGTEMKWVYWAWWKNGRWKPTKKDGKGGPIYHPCYSTYI